MNWTKKSGKMSMNIVKMSVNLTLTLTKKLTKDTFPTRNSRESGTLTMTFCCLTKSPS
jgi:hypothetical protein